VSAKISALVLFSLLKTNDESTAVVAAGAIRTVRVGGTARGTVVVCVFFSLLVPLLLFFSPIANRIAVMKWGAAFFFSDSDLNARAFFLFPLTPFS
jgi:hypothetical protein